MKKDLETLQGTWNIVTLEMDGQKLPAGGAQILIKGKRFTTTAMGATYAGMIAVEEKNTPKTFDLKFTSGPEKGNTNFGIYELDGDTWKICLSITGKDRPKEFTTKTGSGHALETLQREQPGKKQTPGQKSSGQGRGGAGEATQSMQDVPGMPFEPVPELGGEWAMAACVMDGNALDASMLKWGKRVANGNELTVFMGPQVLLKARFTVNRTTAPKTMDYVLLQGPHKGKTQYGIYELEGKILKTCFTAPGGARPTDFSSVPGDGRTSTVWKLTKK